MHFPFPADCIFQTLVFSVYVFGLVDLFTLQSLNCIHLNDYCVFAEPVEPARQLQLLQHPTHTILNFWNQSTHLQHSKLCLFFFFY